MKTNLIIIILIILIMALPSPTHSQGYEYSVRNYLPFTAGNDTLFGADTITSTGMYIGNWTGAVTLGFQVESVGDSAAALTVQAKVGLSGLSTGLPADSASATADSVWLQIGIIDSADVAQNRAVYFPLPSFDWWYWTENLDLRVIQGASGDTNYVKSRLRGQ